MSVPIEVQVFITVTSSVSATTSRAGDSDSPLGKVFSKPILLLERKEGVIFW